MRKNLYLNWRAICHLDSVSIPPSTFVIRDPEGNLWAPRNLAREGIVFVGHLGQPIVTGVFFCVQGVYEAINVCRINEQRMQKTGPIRGQATKPRNSSTIRRAVRRARHRGRAIDERGLEIISEFRSLSPYSQTAVRGTFELPAAAHFGSSVLPPGHYTISFLHITDGVPFIHLKGEGCEIGLPAAARPGEKSGRNSLDIADIGGAHFIQAFNFGSTGASFIFGVDKPAARGALRTSVRRPITVPVFMRIWGQATKLRNGSRISGFRSLSP